MKKLIYLGPLMILGLGMWWTTQVFLAPTILYCLGFSFFMLLLLSIPSFLLAGGLRMFAKKKVANEVGEVEKQKRNFWYLYCLYTSVFGIGLFTYLILTRQ